MNYSKPKSEERKAIEYAMRWATADKPLTALQIVELAGLDYDKQTQRCIANIVVCGLAYNKNAGRRGAGAYVWGQPPKPDAAARKSLADRGLYYGERPIPIRSGALDAYTLASLQGGTRVERRPPMIVGSKVAVAGRGV